MLELIRQRLLEFAVKTPGDGRASFTFDNREFFGSRYCAAEALSSASLLWARIAHLKPQVLVYKGTGASALVSKMQDFALAAKSPVDVLAVRDQRKAYGMHRLVEGPSPDRVSPGARAVFVDDLINRGDTFRQAKAAIETEGYELSFVAVAALIDFWNGSRQLRADGLIVESLFRRHDLGLTRRDSTSSIVSRVYWHAPQLNTDTGLEVKSWPRIGGGMVLVGADDGSFQAFNKRTGDRVWRHESERPQFKGNVSVPVSRNGRVYTSSYDGTVRCFETLTGRQFWATKIDSNVHSSPVLNAEGTRLFVGTEWDKRGDRPETWQGRGDIVCLSTSTGIEVWRTRTKGMVPCTPAVDPLSGIVLCASNDFHTYALDPDDGRVYLKCANKGEVKGRPKFWGDALFVTVSVGGWVQAYSRLTGALLWEKQIGVGAIHPYPLIYRHLLYTVNSDGMVYCIDESGHTQWITRLRNRVGWGLVPFDGKLLALTEHAQLVSLCPETGLKLSSDNLQSIAGFEGARTMQPPSIDYHTRVAYIASNNRGLLAVSLK